MANFEIGVQVDDKGAIKSLNNVDKSIEKIGDTSKKTSKEVTQNTNKMSMGMKALGGKINAAGRKGTAAFKSMASSIMPVVKVATIAIATIGALTFGVKKFTDGLAEMGDNVGKASQRMGVSIEFYQKMASAAGHAGTSIGTMESGMRKMLLKMTMVEQGNALATKAFEDLGVAVFDVDGKMRDQEDVFTDSLVALSKMQNATARNAKAQEVLGRSASTLAPLFNEGAAAVKNYMEANDSAIIVSQRLTVASALYNDTMQTVGEKLAQAKNKGLEPFMESMAELSVQLLNSDGFETALGWVNSIGGALSGAVEQLNLFTQGVAIIGLEKLEDKLSDINLLIAAQEEVIEKVRAKLDKKRTASGKRLFFQEMAFHRALAATRIKLEEEIEEKRKQVRSNAGFDPVVAPEIITKNTEDVKKNTAAVKKWANQYDFAFREIAQSGKDFDLSGFLKFGAEPEADDSISFLASIFGGTPEEITASAVSFADQLTSGIQSVSDSIFAIKENARKRELAALENQHKNELKGFRGSNGARLAMEIEQEKKEDQLRKSSFEKKKKQDKSNAVLNMLSSIGGAWASAMQLPYPANIIVGAANSALMTGIGAANIAQINAQEYFANSGFVGGGAGGATGGGDNRMVGAREGELFLNGRDQKTLMDAIKGQNLGGGASVHIENFSGSDEDLTRLEDMLRALESNGRLQLA